LTTETAKPSIKVVSTNLVDKGRKFGFARQSRP